MLKNLKLMASGDVIRGRRKVLVTGKGLLGTAFKEVAKWEYFSNLDVIFPEAEFDLTNIKKAWLMMEAYKPDIVIHTAAKVGGVKLNRDKPADMFYENMAMTSNVIHAACQNKVKKIIGFGSTCAFDGSLTYLDENTVHCGRPFPNNEAYAYAKRMTEVHLRAAHEQYGVDYTYYVPVSMYGANDNFNLDNGHVIPSLIHKCYNALYNGEKFCVWGDGEVYREVIWSEDVAAIVLLTMLDDVGTVLLSSGQQAVSIKEMATEIAKSFNCIAGVTWEKDKPQGQKHRPPVNPSKMFALLKEYGFEFTDFKDGIRQTCAWFTNNYPNVRM